MLSRNMFGAFIPTVAKNITKQDHLDIHIYPKFIAVFCILDPQKYKKVSVAIQPNEKARKIESLSVPKTRIARFKISMSMFF